MSLSAKRLAVAALLAACAALVVLLVRGETRSAARATAPERAERAAVRTVEALVAPPGAGRAPLGAERAPDAADAALGGAAPPEPPAPGTGSVVGSVLDLDGDPLAFHGVGFVRRGPAASAREAYSREDGTYAVEGLAHGTWTAVHYGRDLTGVRSASVHGEVEVLPGRAVGFDFQLAGTRVLEGGFRLGDDELSQLGRDSSLTCELELWTASEPRVLVAWAECSTAPEHVRRGMRLPPETSGAPPPEGASDDAPGPVWGTGDFRIEGLPPGSYVLRVTAPATVRDDATGEALPLWLEREVDLVAGDLRLPSVTLSLGELVDLARERRARGEPSR